jgi:hypothetical protein
MLAEIRPFAKTRKNPAQTKLGWATLGSKMNAMVGPPAISRGIIGLEIRRHLMKSIRSVVRLRSVLMAATAVAIFLLPASWAGNSYRVLHSFGSGSDGTLPSGPPALDEKGNLCGVTFDGPTGRCSDYGCGIVFELRR